MDQRPVTSIEQPVSRNQKRVLMLLTNAFDPDPRVHQEAKCLVENGYDVTILCWDRDYKAAACEIMDGIRVERIYVHSTHGRGTSQVPFLLLFWLKAYAEAVSKHFDIVHCHDFDTLPLGYVLSGRKKAKLIYDAHESYVDMLGNISHWLRWMIYRIEDFLLRRTDLLITVGEILRQHLAKRGAQRTGVVGNWKDPAKFEFPREDLEEEKRRLGIMNGQLIISFIANLSKERKLSELVGAIKDTPGTVLIVGGEGPSKRIVEDAARKYPNIIYLGYVPPSRVPFYTAIADVIFYGFDPMNPNARFSAPNKLFEALAAGKAVLTGNFGEIGKIVRETQCGLILGDFSEEEIRAGISKLNPEVLSRVKENALRTGRVKYNWQQAGSNLLSLYSRLVKGEEEPPGTLAAKM